MVYHWTRDFAVPPSYGTGKFDTQLLVDVDHYLDMNFWLRKPTTVIMYSFQPTKPAGCTEEYSWAFRKNGTVRYVLAAGDVFGHEVWNWTANSMFISRGLFSTTIYWVDSQPAASPEHRVIILTPMFTTGLFGSLFLRLFNFDEAVTRYKTHVSYGDKSFHIVEHGTHINLCTTDADGYAFLGSTFTHKEMGDAMSIIRGSHNSSSTTILSALEEGNKTAPRACLLHEYLVARAAQKFKDPFSATVVGRGGNKILYTTTEPDLTNVPKGQPLSVETELACCFAVSGKPAAHSALGGRVEPGRKFAKASTAYVHNELVRDFAKELFPTPIEPVGIMEVLAALDKTKHKKLRERFLPDFEIPGHPKANLMVKAEPYSKVSESRPLVSFDVQTLHTYSAYMIAISNVLGSTDWYAFGRSPSQLNDLLLHMNDKVTAKHKMVETDYSGFDTTVGGIRDFEEIILRQAFTGHHQHVVLALWRKQLDIRIRATGNYKEHLGYYTAKGERLSGSAETSCLNTIDNAIISYIANRRCGLPHKEAWRQLGLYGGDDGVTPCLNPVILESIASSCGLVLKATIRKPSEPYCFLGRYYNTWARDTSSYYDPVRALTRIQYTDDKTVSPEVALQRKFSALQITDARTPWVEDLLKKYDQLYGKDYPLLLPADLGYSSENWVALQCLQYGEKIEQPEVAPDWAWNLYVPCLEAAKITFGKSLERATSINGTPTGNPPTVCTIIRTTPTSAKPTSSTSAGAATSSGIEKLKKGPTRSERSKLKWATRAEGTTPSQPSINGASEKTPLMKMV
jgi:hypothetical protein